MSEPAATGSGSSGEAPANAGGKEAFSQPQTASQSEERLRLILDAAGVVAWELDELGRLHETGPVDKVFGRPAGFHHAGLDEFIENIAPEDRERVRSRIQEAWGGEANYHAEFGVVQADGSKRWLEANGMAVRDRAGRPARLVGIARDITERRRIEQKLQQFQCCIENAPESVHWLGADGRLLYANRAMCQALGYSKEELEALHLWEIDPIYGQDRFLAEWASYQKDKREGGVFIETQHRRKDGSLVPVEVMSKHLWIEGAEFHLAFARDISERERAETALKESERRFRTLFENMTEGVALHELLYDGQGEPADYRVVDANPAYGKHTGLMPEQARGQLGSQLYRTGAPPYLKEFAAVAQSGKPLVFETFFPPLQRHFQISVVSQKPGFFATVFEDISERKRLESQLRQAQKMEAVGHLAGGVAHDFNNILAAIMLQLGLMRNNPDADVRTREALNDLEGHANRAANLTRQLLLFGRRSVTEIRSLNLNEVTNQLQKTLRRLLGEHIQVDFHPQEPLPLVEGDSGMIEQALMNLALNARDAMPKGGRLMFQTEVAQIGNQTTEVDNHPAGRYVRLSVMDTGCGMDESILKHLFEPFFTTKEAGKGTGLGLATVYGIIKQHRGWLTVESAPGKGSTFRVWLPAKERVDATQAVSAALEPVVGGNETILLVEDDASVRRVASQCLRMFGYDVVEAVDAEEAVKAWSRHAQDISLLLTDMVMPGGTSGLDLAERLRSEKPDLKVILCTGYSAQLETQEPQRPPWLVYLAKPFVTAVLGSTVRACLDGRSNPAPTGGGRE